MKTKTIAASAALALSFAMPSLASAHSSHGFGSYKFGSESFGSKFGQNSFKAPMGEHHYSGFRWTAYTQKYVPQGCGWLKARAIETGNPSWWERYSACKGY